MSARAVPPVTRRAVRSGLAVFAVLGAALLALLPPLDAPASRNIRLRIDPGAATPEELRLLPGIGPGLAQRIIEHRAKTQRKPPFADLESLADVHGLGPLRLERLRPYLRFDRGPSP